MNTHKQLALGKSIAGGAQVGDLGSAYILFCLHCVGAALPSPEDQGNCPWQDGDFSSSPLALNTELKVHWQQTELVAQREAYQVALHIHLLWELGSPTCRAQNCGDIKHILPQRVIKNHGKWGYFSFHSWFPDTYFSFWDHSAT